MLALEAQLNQPCVGLGGSFVVYLGLTVRPSASAPGMPVHVCVLLDVSGSMAGEKSEQAREAIRVVWRGLAPEDTLTLVSFSGDTRVLLSSQRRGDAKDKVLEDALAALMMTGVTRLDLGLAAAARAMAKSPAGEPRRIWLVTDGQPTDARGHQLEDVSELIKLAQTIAAQGISLGALGLGDAANYRFQFLADLADRGRGTYFYARDPAELASLLREELRAAKDVATLDARIDLELQQGAVMLSCERVVPEYRPHDIEVGTQHWQVAVGDFPLPESTYLLELRVAVNLGQPPGVRVIGKVLVQGQALGRSVTSPPVEITVEHAAKASRRLSIRNDRIENLRINLLMERNIERRGRTDDPAEKLRLTLDAADAARRTGNLPLANDLDAQVQQLLAGGALSADQEARTTKDARVSGKLPQFSSVKADA